jgi:hypothetical protein
MIRLVGFAVDPDLDCQSDVLLYRHPDNLEDG